MTGLKKPVFKRRNSGLNGLWVAELGEYTIYASSWGSLEVFKATKVKVL